LDQQDPLDILFEDLADSLDQGPTGCLKRFPKSR